MVKYTAGWLRRSPSLSFGLIFVALVALYYYIGRSSHTGSERVELELRLQEVHETIFMARPALRSSIGYPAVMALVYLYRRYPFKELVLILGLGVMMGSISVVAPTFLLP